MTEAVESHVAAAKPDTTHGKILYMEDVTVSFDGFRALDRLTLYVDDGELRCIIGPNGAGKTTMMDVITGKTRPDTGTAFFGQTTDLLRCPRRRSPRPASAASSRSPRCSKTTACSKTWSSPWPGTSGCGRPCWPGSAAPSVSASKRSWKPWAWPRSGGGSPGCSPTARSNGWRSACCSCRSPGCCWWTSRWRG